MFSFLALFCMSMSVTHLCFTFFFLISCPAFFLFFSGRAHHISGVFSVVVVLFSLLSVKTTTKEKRSLVLLFDPHYYWHCFF